MIERFFISQPFHPPVFAYPVRFVLVPKGILLWSPIYEIAISILSGRAIWVLLHRNREFLFDDIKVCVGVTVFGLTLALILHPELDAILVVSLELDRIWMRSQVLYFILEGVLDGQVVIVVVVHPFY